MVLVPDVNGAGGSMTMAVAGLSPVALKMNDGTSNLPQALLIANAAYTFVYSGTVFRLQSISYDPTKSTSLFFQGVTSGGSAFAAADAAGSLITYIMPIWDGSTSLAAKVLTDNGPTSCGTYATGNPTTCHQLIWSTPSSGSTPVTYTSAATSPALAWAMNEGTGTTFATSVGTDNAITASGVAWQPHARTRGFAPYFDGTFSASSANFTSFNPANGTPFSVSVWADFNDLASLQIIAAQFSMGTNNPGWYFFKNNTVGANPAAIIIQQLDSSGAQLTVTCSSILYAPNTTTSGLYNSPMYHFVVTFDGTGSGAGVKLYVNGTQDTGCSSSGSATGGTTQPSNNIYIGSWPVNTSNRLIGHMAGLKLFTKVLNQTDVTTLFINGPSAPAAITYPTLTSQSIKASEIPGVTLDCNLTTGLTASGGACTDNTASIELILNSATAAKPVELVMDGGTTTTGIHIPMAGHVTIRGVGWDSGFFVKSGSNNPCITNGYGIYPYGPVPTRGADVILRNFKCHGNRGTYPSGNSTRTDGRGDPWIAGIDVGGINNLTMDNVWIYDAPAYQIHTPNVGNVWLTNSLIEGSGGTNQDGFHITGPSNDIHIDNVTLKTLGDDGFALNAPEDYGGSIDRTTISNINLVNTYNLMRAYQYYSGTGAFGINDLNVHHVTGTATSGGGLIVMFSPGGQPTGSADLANNVSFSDIAVAYTNNTAPVPITGAWGGIQFNNVSWISPAGAQPFISVAANATISSIGVYNGRIYKNASGNSGGYLISVASGGTVKKLTVNGFGIENMYGQSYSASSQLIDVPSGGAITSLVVNAVDPTNISALVSSGSYARITNIMGRILPDLTVSTLPTCNAASAGAQARVSDASSPTFLGTLTGGSTTKTGVTCNGTAWVAQ